MNFAINYSSFKYIGMPLPAQPDPLSTTILEQQSKRPGIIEGNDSAISGEENEVTTEDVSDISDVEISDTSDVEISDTSDVEISDEENEVPTKKIADIEISDE